MKFKDIFEVRKPSTKTKTKSQDQDDPFMRAFGNMGTAGAGDQAPAVAPPRQPRRQRNNPLRQADAATTRARAANVTMPAGAGERFAAIQNMNLDDEMNDDEVRNNVDTDRPEPRPPGTDLATINTAIARAGEVEPDWHQVRNLPGYLQRPIRSLGRQVFGSLTSTPIEEIQLLASLGDSGQPNTVREINAVAAWLRDNAERDTDGEIDFERSIPDYKAEFFIYKVQGMTFMLVKDFAGQYIYNWPSADEERLEGPENRVDTQLQRRLR